MEGCQRVYGETFPTLPGVHTVADELHDIEVLVLSDSFPRIAKALGICPERIDV